MTDRKEIDTTRPCVTGDGRKAEFLAEITSERWPLVFVSTDSGGRDQVVIQAARDGEARSGWSSKDIINAPQTREVWHFVYKFEGRLVVYTTEYCEARPSYTPSAFTRNDKDIVCGWQGPFTITDQPQGED